MYIIKKDGLWLMGVRYLGIRHVGTDGVERSLPTGLYGTRRADAMVVEDRSLARALGGEAVQVKAKGRAYGGQGGR